MEGIQESRAIVGRSQGRGPSKRASFPPSASPGHQSNNAASSGDEV